MAISERILRPILRLIALWLKRYKSIYNMQLAQSITCQHLIRLDTIRIITDIIRGNLWKSIYSSICESLVLMSLFGVAQ